MDMLDFYKQKMNDENLSEKDRETYRKMYESMVSKEEAAKLKAEIAEQQRLDAARADKEDEDCAGGGCKI